MARITVGGEPVNTNGELPSVGSKAPDFHLVDSKLHDVHLANYAGKKILMNIVPSLDTPTCATSTKKFNAYGRANADTVMLVISADLPFAQGRFCEAEGIENMVALSLMRTRGFAKDYGVLITDGPLAGITARAVVVVGADGKVKYTQLVSEVADEPDYEAAIKALA